MTENHQQSTLTEMSGPWYIDESEPTCPDCGGGFDTEAGVRNHYTRLHSEPYPWWETKTCNYCGEEYTRASQGNKNLYCSKNCAGKDTVERVDYVGFILEDHNGYPKWNPTYTNSVSVHQLLAIANGADPYKVFGNPQYNIDHKNGIKIDNRPENIQLVKASEHGRKDGAKNGWFYSHTDLLRVIEFFTPLGDAPPLKSEIESEEP